MRNKLLTGLLCLSMVFGLCACGSTSEKVEETTTSKESAASVENGSLSAESAVVSVGKTTVSYDEYRVYNYLMKNQYRDIFDDSVWDYAGNDMEDSIGQEAVMDVVRLIIQVKVICKAAATQGVELAADEKEEADHSATEYCEGISDEEKTQNGISQNVMSRIFEENKLADKMYRVVTGKVDVNVTKDQSKAVRLQLIYLKAGADDKEAVRANAQALLEQAKALQGNFYNFASENTQADEVESLVGQMDSRENLVANTIGLKQGTLSGVIEESDGFYIAYCVEAAGNSLAKEYKNQVIEERQTKAFQESYAEWAKNYSVRVSKSLLVGE